MTVRSMASMGEDRTLQSGISSTPPDSAKHAANGPCSRHHPIPSQKRERGNWDHSSPTPQ